MITGTWACDTDKRFASEVSQVRIFGPGIARTLTCRRVPTSNETSQFHKIPMYPKNGRSGVVGTTPLSPVHRLPQAALPAHGKPHYSFSDSSFTPGIGSLSRSVTSVSAASRSAISSVQQFSGARHAQLPCRHGRRIHARFRAKLQQILRRHNCNFSHAGKRRAHQRPRRPAAHRSHVCLKRLMLRIAGCVPPTLRRIVVVRARVHHRSWEKCDAANECARPCCQSRTASPSSPEIQAPAAERLPPA